MEMHPPQQLSRVDLAELKALLLRKLGPVLSKQYFYHLNKFLSLKISKVEFNKICCRILGRENIALHNEFIKSILRNACSAKHPPPRHVNNSLKVTSLPNGTHNASNKGEMLPSSPRKPRTGFRDRRSGDRCSTLGPNGMTNFASPGGKQSSDLNGVPITDIVQELDLHQERLTPHAQDQLNVSVKDLHAVSKLQPPLGLPFCSAHKATMSSSSSSSSKCFNSGVLLDNVTLRERMEQIGTSQGLEGGVSVDCANILNKGLDAYLKGLISSCVKLISARSGHELINYKKHSKLVNGVKSEIQTSSSKKPLELSPVSLQNFRVAMELNPQQLGQDWPVLLEKICSRCYEE